MHGPAQTISGGFAQAGIEQLAEPAEAGLIRLRPLPLNAERRLASSVLWASLPFVRAGRVYDFPPTWQFGGLVSASRFAALLGVSAVERNVAGQPVGSDAARAGPERPAPIAGVTQLVATIGDEPAPAGLLAAVLGGAYLVWGLSRRR